MTKVTTHNLNFLQMQREGETWLRVIDFLIAENIFLKNRLSEVIQNDVSGDVLEQIENYQNSFITKDTVLALLAKDIKEHKNTIEKALFNDDDWIQKLVKNHHNLRGDIGKTEKEFINLRSNFNTFLLNIFK